MKKRDSLFALAAMLLALVLYVASFGPVYAHYLRKWGSSSNAAEDGRTTLQMKMLDAVYRPIFRLCERSERVRTAASLYVEWFLPKAPWTDRRRPEMHEPN